MLLYTIVLLGERLVDFETGEAVQGKMQLGGYEVRILLRERPEAPERSLI